MARRKSITKRRRGLFLEKLRTTGSVTKSAIAGEISRQSWYDLRSRDPAFGELWDDAELEFLDNCEAEAIRRAVLGVDEDRPYTFVRDEVRDGVVHTLKETRFRTINTKSDRLLDLVLSRRHPNYKPVTGLELTNPDGNLTPEAFKVDYSDFSDEELRTFTQLQRKLHATARERAGS